MMFSQYFLSLDILQKTQKDFCLIFYIDICKFDINGFNNIESRNICSGRIEHNVRTNTILNNGNCVEDNWIIPFL